MDTKPNLAILAFLAVLALAGCRKEGHTGHQAKDTAGISDSIRLSWQEIEQYGLQFAPVTEIRYAKTATCQGYLAVPPESLVRLAAPVPGIVKAAYCTAGQYIEAGTRIALIENMDILKLKQDYLEAENQLDYAHEEYRRQGELTVENATSMKRMQAARRDFQSAEIKRNALRSQLQLFGINADSLKSGQLTPYIDVKAITSGSVTEIVSRQGSFVSAGDALLVLCTGQSPLIRLDIPEQMLPFLKKSMLIDFYLLPDSSVSFGARLSSLPRSIDPVNHNAVIYAVPLKKDDQFIPGRSVTARLQLTGILARAVPSEAIFETAGGSFIFLKNSGMICRIAVKTGDSTAGLTVLKDFPWNEYADSVIIHGGSHLNILFGNR